MTPPRRYIFPLVRTRLVSFFVRCLWLGASLAPGVALADPEADVRAAVSALARTSYRWETTVRQRFKGETAEPRLDANAPVATRGRSDPAGFTEIRLEPTREFAARITAGFRYGDAVALTPSGWLRRSEIKQVPGGDRSVEFDGKQLRLSRVLGEALKATALRPLAEELLDFSADLKSFREVQGLILAELREGAIERLWGDPQAKRAPEVQGTAIFKLNEAGLAEYHVVLAIGFPNARTKTVAWSVQQWSTRITGHGVTTVELPAEAVRALEK